MAMKQGFAPIPEVTRESVQTPKFNEAMKTEQEDYMALYLKRFAAYEDQFGAPQFEAMAFSASDQETIQAWTDETAGDMGQINTLYKALHSIYSKQYDGVDRKWKNGQKEALIALHVTETLATLVHQVQENKDALYAGSAVDVNHLQQGDRLQADGEGSGTTLKMMRGDQLLFEIDTSVRAHELDEAAATLSRLEESNKVAARAKQALNDLKESIKRNAKAPSQKTIPIDELLGDEASTPTEARTPSRRTIPVDELLK